MIDVKQFRIITGEEIIAEVTDFRDGFVTIKNALVVIPSQQQYGFAPWASVISHDDPDIVLDMKHVIYQAEVHPDVVAKYNEMFGSKLIVPESKKLVV